MDSSEYQQKYLDQIKALVLSEIDPAQVMVFLFGSRAGSRQTSRSDVDIGLLCSGKLPDRLYHKIRNAVDDSEIPLPVDIIDFTRVDPLFKKEALKEIIVWNRPPDMKIN